MRIDVQHVLFVAEDMTVIQNPAEYDGILRKIQMGFGEGYPQRKTK